MQREIKFRGKSLDTGDWVYGYLVSGNYDPQLKNYTKTWIMHFGRLQGALKKQEVDPKTVGQYIGLKDKNGEDVYEGDNVRDRPGNKVVVVYKAPSFMPDRSFGGFNAMIDWIEIIGNIYENPEGGSNA